METERIRQTPSQTLGPFSAYSLTAEQYGYPYNSIVSGSLISPNTPGNRIYITGRVLDGQGDPVPDAVVELWQADRNGRYRTAPISPKNNDGTDFMGFGRVGTGTQAGAMFRFETIKPGPINNSQAPHINIIVFMRGALRALYTRLYFLDEWEANAQDKLLNTIPAERRYTLIADVAGSPAGTVYNLDIHLQGDRETVFFDV